VKKNKDETEKAKKYAFRLLSQRPYTEKELQDKLFKKGYTKIIVDTLQKGLKDLNFINDQEFALSYIETKLSEKPKGRYLLIQELQRKGICREVIEQSLNKLLPKKKESFLAMRLAERKIKEIKSLKKVPTRQRIYLYLRSRGFGEEIIEEVIGKINYATTEQQQIK